ncbi:MAG: head-tail adaptor protein [Oscillospiraceae bacterium]|jgi:head-tail adaptor|nr:head-tail adaptor protein [Oscillospiraceae bacterium]
MKLKDKKIEILQPSYAMNDCGLETETFTPIAPPVWAYYRQLSGKEIFAAQSIQPVEEVIGATI